MKKYIISLFVALGLVAGFAPAANAANDFHFTIVAKSFDHDSQSATIKSQKRLLINGSQQLTWENSNHGIKVTAAQIKAAPKISTACTSSNRRTQSTQIFKKTHGARVVVIKPGSCLWNRGMRDQYRIGFKYYVKQRVVLRVDSHHRYRHSHTLKTKSQLQRGDTVVGKVVLGSTTFYIVKSCLNFIGGPVDTYTSNPVQVRYQQDVKYSGELEVKSNVSAEVTFNVSCPNGANFNTKVNASASGYAWSEINFTERTRVSVMNATRVTLNDSSWLDAEQKATSEASLSITVEGTCGENPPPSYQAPTASGQANACVVAGQQDGVITASGTNPNNVAAPGTLVVGGKTKEFASVGAGQTVTWDFSGFAPGTYNGSFTLGSPINKSASFTVTVNPCPPVEHQNPTAEIFVGEHAVDLYGTMPVFGRVKAFDGATATLGSPVVTPSDLGMISNWRTVSTERDGVTPCETGYVCYQGTFRVIKDGTPGTYVYGTLQATATDTKGGSFTTDPLQFSVYYANHPNL